MYLNIGSRSIVKLCTIPVRQFSKIISSAISVSEKMLSNDNLSKILGDNTYFSYTTTEGKPKKYHILSSGVEAYWLPMKIVLNPNIDTRELKLGLNIIG